ncbi:M24 family metallopeptidase [Aeoliella mucimassa]|uniref:Putative peptidase n=1 Tax=Aeoliella mucimassa TaxID=2527972 RepID=A0A518ANR3_9BACT|nr:Xaa-Pro peptidase family protein [Aeoliella mucimassa]QDU56341.1 putative peptidase [Aeoliella mucimassa]
MSNSAPRLKKLRKLLRKAGTDALLVTNHYNATYLSGFTGEDSYLLVTQDDETLITDQRFTLHLADECPDLPLVIRGPGQQMLPTVGELIVEKGIERLGIEGASMTIATQQAVAEHVPDVSFVVTNGLVEELRTVKDKSEIDATRLACQQAAKAFMAARALIRQESTEKEIAAELEYQARRFGAKGLSFPVIVAVGQRAALPHAQPTDKRVSESDFTLIDWGANSGLYLSDLTRMVVTGRLSPKFKKVYQVVLEAQLKAIEAIKPGASCAEIDKVARDHIDAAGYGKYFGHGLGHGTGLEIHEAPRLGSNQGEVLLEPGMIVTVEPGIYLPEWGGIRIEDDVLVTKAGHEVLTDVPKQLEDCCLS